MSAPLSQGKYSSIADGADVLFLVLEISVKLQSLTNRGRHTIDYVLRFIHWYDLPWFIWRAFVDDWPFQSDLILPS